jgi:NADH-quinone oxidoreductase subunit H
VATCTIACFIFWVAAFAETNRVPFDLPEAESELVAGYHSEYSAMKFSMFFIAEYANVTTASALLATLFFGGWDIPFTTWDNVAPHTFWKTLITFAFLWAKISVFIFIFIWVRWTVPRFRYDQLMALGWKVMLPLALAYIVVIAAACLGLQAAGFHSGQWQFTIGLVILNVICVALVFWLMDRGRVISPAYSRLERRDIDKLQRAMRDRARFQPADVGAGVGGGAD